MSTTLHEPAGPSGTPASAAARRSSASRPPGRVLVTGAASGLGRAVAAAVAGAGGQPLLLDRVDPLRGNGPAPAPDAAGGGPGPDPEAGDRLAQAPTAVVDLVDARAAERAVRGLVERAGGLDAVVTAAGTDRCGPLDDVPGAEWDRVVQVNLLGTAAVIRAALPALKQAHGRIVTVASTLALRALPDATAYCASKFGVLGMSRALAAELQGRVGVTTLVPGGMATAFFDDRTEQYRPGPDARLNDPSDVAATVLFALTLPEGCEVRELVVCPSEEPSWP